MVARRNRGPARLQVTATDGRHRRTRLGALATWLPAAAPASVRGEVAVALVTDARMRVLNRTFRHVDGVTDVLSFPAGAGPASDGRNLLGDIVIARGVARRQARRAGHSLGDEVRVLALHGLLHLAGYDHDDPRDAGRMARLERRLRRRAGLREGLIERGTGA
jgi:probable rRNA maturation factor